MKKAVNYTVSLVVFEQNVDTVDVVHSTKIHPPHHWFVLTVEAYSFVSRARAYVSVQCVCCLIKFSMSSKKRVLNSIMLIRYIIWWNKEIIFGLSKEWKQSESSEKCVDFVCFTWYLSLIIAIIFLLFFHYFLIIFSFTKAGMLTFSKLSYVLYFIIICWMGLSKKMCYLYQDNVTLKTQEARGPHHSPAKEFQSINTFAQSNDYAIALWDKPSPSPFEGSKVDH